MKNIDKLANRLAPHYSRFHVSNRLLFTGHSHQAWPDVALEGLEESFSAASSRVDNKWETAFKKTEKLRTYLRSYYDDPEGLYCLGPNTHQLLVAWLSSFDLGSKPKIITTDSEFHSMSRQLQRLKEEGMVVAAVDAHADDMVQQVERHCGPRTAAMMLSRVFFESGRVNQYLPELAELARMHHIPFLIDDYHGTNVVPLSLTKSKLDDCFLLSGGYKYLQWGEGNCFLRFPKNCRLRPVVTGWFASFSSLDEPRSEEQVKYDDSNQRFASGTYDPASQFRAARVVSFFENQGLTPAILREQYLGQVSLLKNLFQEQNFSPGVIKLCHHRPLEENGGFLALRSPFARTIRAKLMEKEVFTDARGDILRFGPAPYTTSQQIEQAMEHLTGVVGQLNP